MVCRPLISGKRLHGMPVRASLSGVSQVGLAAMDITATTEVRLDLIACLLSTKLGVIVVLRLVMAASLLTNLSYFIPGLYARDLLFFWQKKEACGLLGVKLF